MDDTVWRLILSQPGAGAWNMALDEAILDSVISGEQPPTLRFYSWEPACLSLGHAQPIDQVDLDALKSHGWDLVRRPTGGRAILHVDELTYSVCAGQNHPIMSGGLLESYRRLAAALVSGLELLGIHASADSRYTLPAGSPADAAVCFEIPSNYEITADGKKLIGSAQARRNLGVLQHGSLPLYGDLTRITEVLRFDDAVSLERAKQRLLDHAVTAETILGVTPTWRQAAQAMTAAFTDALGLTLEPSDPTPEEFERAERLVAEKYSSPGWTYRL